MSGLAGGTQAQTAVDLPLQPVIHSHHFRSFAVTAAIPLEALFDPQVTFRQPYFTRPRDPAPLIPFVAVNLLPIRSIVQPTFRQQDWKLVPAPFQFDRDFTVTYSLTLVGKDRCPPGKFKEDLTPRAYPFHVELRTWLWKYNRNLTGKDQLPTGGISAPLPVGPEYAIQLRQWVGVMPPAAPVAAPFVQDDWPIPVSAPFQLREWYGRIPPAPTTVPFVQDDWPLPQGTLFQLREWYGRIPPVSIAVPFSQEDWLNQQRVFFPADLVSISASYNLNLIGQDKLPTGIEITDLPPQPALSAIQLRTWINSVSLALLAGTPTKPFAQYDWPLNFGPLQPTSIFTATFNKNLVGQDNLPSGEIVTDLPPRAPQQPTPIFTATYNKNLIGQDQLPAGKDVIDLPPQPPLSAIQLRTWINTTSLALLAGPQVRPFWQSDWPINIGPRQPIQAFTASYNRNLVGKDQLPNGEIAVDLPPQLTPSLLRSWINTVNLALLPAPTRPAGKAVTDRVVLPTYVFNTWISSVNLTLNFAPPPVVTEGVRRAPYFSPSRGYGREWYIISTPLNTIGLLTGVGPPVIFPFPHNQYSWPLPQSATPGYEQRYSITYQGNNPFLGSGIPPVGPIPPPPEPTPPEDKRLIYNAGNEWQQLDRIREPGPVGWR